MGVNETKVSRRRAAAWMGLAAAFALSGCATNNLPDAASEPRRAAPIVQAVEEAPKTFGDKVAVEPGQPGVVALLAPMGASRNNLDVIGRSIANGAQLALSDLGLGDPAGGGLQLKLYDTGGTAQGAALAAEAAARDGAAMILGPLLSRSVSSVGPVALEAGLPVIAFSTDSAVAGDNVFLIGFLPETEMQRMASFAASNGIFSFGALSPQTLEGDVTLAAFQSAALGVGGEVLAVERYQQTFVEIESAARRYADAHKAIAETRPIAGILLADGGQALNSVAAYLPFFEIDPRETRFIGVGKWNDPIVFREPSLRGGWFAGPDPMLREQFASRYQAAFGMKPHSLASLGYDAMAAAGAMADEARRNGARFPFTRGSITAPVGFVGVNGVFRFQPNGLNQRGLAVLEVGADGFKVVDPAPGGFAGG